MTITVKDFYIEHNKITMTSCEPLNDLPMNSVLEGNTTYNNRFTVIGRDGFMAVLIAAIPIVGFNVGTKLTTV